LSNFRNDLKEVHRVAKQDGQLHFVGAVYKNKKFDRRSQRIVDAIGMAYLSIEEFREVLEELGSRKSMHLKKRRKDGSLSNARKRGRHR
jgi:adenylate cyclase class IV